jgi:hypothetical protein
MFKKIIDVEKNNAVSLKKDEQVQLIDELFSEIVSEARNFNAELKLRFIEAYFYASQRDIQQAMTDFDRLGSADRLIVGYFIQRLAQCSELSLKEKPLSSAPRQRRERSKLNRPSPSPKAY